MNMREYISETDVRSFLTNTPQITFEVTDKCNLSCEYCGYGKFYSNYSKRGNKRMSFKQIKPFIDYLVQLWETPLNKSIKNNIYISFYGGEPLLNMDFIRTMIEYTENLNSPFRSFTYSMTTNAILLNKYMDYLVEKKIHLLLSIDGNEYNTSYRIDHKGNPVFNQIVNNIELLEQKYPSFFESNVEFNAVLHNRNSVSEILDFFKREYNKIPSIGELNTSGICEDMRSEFEKTYNNKVESLYSSENYTEIEKELFLNSPTYHSATMFLLKNSPFSFLNYNELMYGRPDDSEVVPTGTCLPFTKRIFITVNGNILPCERIGHQFSLGKISDEKIDLDFAYIANKYNHYYNRVKSSCKKCHNKRGCYQCIFNLADIDSKQKPLCYGYMDEADFEKYKDNMFRFFKNRPESYAKIMNEVTIK
ncbi:MAG: radical SAM peptide maturase [Tannerella sp.]|jgi:uncharacterized protein|nr:radical SAM peptide maturase [Tannerella sp.]